MKLSDEMQVGAGQDAGVREQKNEDKRRTELEMGNLRIISIFNSSSRSFPLLCFFFFFSFSFYSFLFCTQTPATKVSG